jgi:hypothetical protein
MSNQQRRVDRLEAEHDAASDNSLADAIVRARASSKPLRSEVEVRKMAQQPGLLGRIARACLQAGLYENSPADRARCKQIRLDGEASAESEATDLT